MNGLHGLRAGLMAALAAGGLVACAPGEPPGPFSAGELTPLLLSAEEIGFTPESSERPLEASGQETAIGVGRVPHSATGACGKSIEAVEATTFTPAGSTTVLYEEGGNTLALGLYSLTGERAPDTEQLYADVLDDCPVSVTDRDLLTKYAFAPLPDALSARGAQGYVVTVHDPVSEGPTRSYVAHLPMDDHGVYLGATGVTEDTAVDAFLAQADKLEEGLR